MDIFQKLPMAKRSAMELLFQNCTEKVKNYMFTMDGDKLLFRQESFAGMRQYRVSVVARTTPAA